MTGPPSTRGNGNSGNNGGGLGSIPPGVKLAGLLEAAAGTGDRYAGLDDDQIMAGVGRWHAVESWVVGRKLAAIRELIRRNPEDGRGPAEPGGLPGAWRRDLCEEIACELRISKPAADRLISLAWTLEQRLPLAAAALDAGILDPSLVKMIASETSVLSDADARAAEAAVAGWWAGKTWSQLQKKIAAAVVNIDPEGARKRREQAARDEARVRFWRERSGNCGMGAYELPADQALKANQNIQRRARQYKAWGIPHPLDILRVMAFLDLINQADSRTQYPKGAGKTTLDQDGQDDDSRDQDGRDDDGWDGGPEDPDRDTGAGGREGDGQDSDGDGEDRDRDGEDGEDGDAEDAEGAEGEDADGGEDGPEDDGQDGDGPGGDWPGGDWPGGDGGPGDGPGGSGGGPEDDGLAANVDLAIPLLDLLGLAQRAGEAHGMGVLDADLARQLAAAAARSPRSSFGIIVTDPDGHAIGYGHATRKRRPRAAGPPEPGRQGQLWPEQSETRPDNCTENYRVTFSPAGPAPAGGYGDHTGYGTWTLTIGDLVLTVTIDPIPAGPDCDHRYETPGYRPSTKLRRLVEIRDGECTLPVCVRHPRGSEWEHTVPWPHGRTCSCNGAMRCRHDHRIKESWHVEQLPGGYHRWTTPSGRTHTKGPKQYPV